jgi:hypothetical protein
MVKEDNLSSLKKSLGEVTSLTECLNICGLKIPLEFKEEVLEKALTMAETIIGCMMVSLAAPVGSDVRRKADKKIAELLDKTTSFDDCMLVANTSPLGKVIKTEALKKALDIAKSPEECLKVHGVAPYGSAIGKEALKKANSFFR